MLNSAMLVGRHGRTALDVVTMMNNEYVNELTLLSKSEQFEI